MNLTLSICAHAFCALTAAVSRIPAIGNGSLVQAIEAITGRRMCVPATALPDITVY
jgi:hypothetical protein